MAFSPDSSLVFCSVGIGVCNEDPPPRAELRELGWSRSSLAVKCWTWARLVVTSAFNPAGEFQADGMWLSSED